MKINKSFTLMEVIVASVLLSIGIGGGIAGYKVANERIGKSSLENVLLNEVRSIEEGFASKDSSDFNEHDWEDIDVSDNDTLDKFDAKVQYKVDEETRSGITYKKITVRGNIENKNVSILSESIKVGIDEPIKKTVEFCGDSITQSHLGETCDPPGAYCDGSCHEIATTTTSNGSTTTSNGSTTTSGSTSTTSGSTSTTSGSTSTTSGSTSTTPGSTSTTSGSTSTTSTSTSTTTASGGGGCGDLDFHEQSFTASCPWIAVWSKGEYIIENEILIAPQFLNHSKNVEELYFLINNPTLKDGQISLQIKEITDEVSYIDFIELYSITLLQGYNLAYMDGKFYAYNPEQAKIALNTKKDYVLDKNNSLVLDFEVGSKSVYLGILSKNRIFRRL